MQNNFLTSVALSDKFLSHNWPLANRTAPWHPISTTITNWLLPHTQNVSYYFNKYGYRDVDWNEQTLNNSIWCFGDSQTVGMGVDKQDIWTSILQNLVDLETLNLGVAGASNDTIARILISCLNLYRPRAVCCLLTAPNRREIINDSYSCTLFPQALKHLTNIDIKLFEQYLDQIDYTADAINRDKNILLITSYCKSMGIPVIIADFVSPISKIIKEDLAYDNLHIGTKTHKMVAEYFANQLKVV